MKKLILSCFSILLLQAQPNITLTCEQGNKDDCNDRGVAYGVKGEFSKAFTLYKKACDLNSSTGCSNFGFMYMNGQGVKKDFVLAVKYLEKSIALGGYSIGATNLGIIYAGGYGEVDINKTKAIKYFTLGCRAKNGFACNFLGTVEHEIKHNKKALFYYDISCDYGSGYGCYNYAQAVYRGQGMDVDIKASVPYFILGCNRGVGYACDTLAGMIIRAEGGLLPDKKLAEVYRKKACDFGAKDACGEDKEYYMRFD